LSLTDTYGAPVAFDTHNAKVNLQCKFIPTVQRISIIPILQRNSRFYCFTISGATLSLTDTCGAPVTVYPQWNHILTTHPATHFPFRILHFPVSCLSLKVCSPVVVVEKVCACVFFALMVSVMQDFIVKYMERVLQRPDTPRFSYGRGLLRGDGPNRLFFAYLFQDNALATCVLDMIRKAEVVG
jgi:hypothetical protein